MKHIWLPLLGLLVGLGIGFAFGKGFHRNTTAPAGSAFLRQLSITNLAGRAGQAQWEILEDQMVEPPTAPASSRAVFRRIVAQASMPEAEQDRFVQRFQDRARGWLDSQGGRVWGLHAPRLDTGRGVDSNRLPRRLYTIGQTPGVADVYCLGGAGMMTLVISLIEVP